MKSSYLANRDKHFWSRLRYGHRRIRSWDYGMTDIAGENAKGCSWSKILITLKNGKTRLATHKSEAIASWHRSQFFIFTPHFPAFTINTLQPLPFWKFHTFPLIKCLVFGILNLFTLMRINETINNNQEDSKQQICFKYYPFNYKNIAYKIFQPETCFGSFEAGWVNAALILHWY